MSRSEVKLGVTSLLNMKKIGWETPWGEIKIASLLLHVSRNTSGQPAVFYQSCMLFAFVIMYKAIESYITIASFFGITTEIIDFIHLIQVVRFGPHSSQ